jgi:hypothetical protein
MATNNKEIEQKLKFAESYLEEAIKIADKTNQNFYFTLPFDDNDNKTFYYVAKAKSYTKDELLEKIKDGTFADLTYNQKEAAIEVLSGQFEDTSWNTSTTEGGWQSSNC